MFNLFLYSFEKHLQLSGFVFSFGLLAFLLKILRRDDSISHGRFSSIKEAIVYPIDCNLPIPGAPQLLTDFQYVESVSGIQSRCETPNPIPLGQQSQTCFSSALRPVWLRDLSRRPRNGLNASLLRTLVGHHGNVDILKNTPWSDADYSVRRLHKIIALAA